MDRMGCGLVWEEEWERLEKVEEGNGQNAQNWSLLGTVRTNQPAKLWELKSWSTTGTHSPVGLWAGLR